MSSPALRALDAALEATVVPSFSRIGYAARRRLFDWDAPAPGSMAGRVVVLTGATGGLGGAIARGVARLGASVWLLGRDLGRVGSLARDITSAVPEAQVRIATADLARLDDVRRVSATLLDQTERIDVLVHNAGILMKHRELTVDALETTTQVHLVAPFLLTSLLLPRMIETSRARVITVSSGGMYTKRLDVAALSPQPVEAFSGVAAYAQTKRAQVVLTEEWSRRATGIAFHAMHPGWVDTPGLKGSLPGFGRLMRPLLRSPEQGADTVLWLAGPAGTNLASGGFWHDRARRSTERWPGTGTPPGETHRLWDFVSAHAGVPR
ncbi:MAG: SDR family NAD(P)-dependent oxidoreductase [Mycobacteriales bacterium]